MDKIHMLTGRESGLATGVKAAALVVILGVFAAIADHTLLASRTPDEGMRHRIALYVDAPIEAPALPDGLRAHEGEVPEHVQAF